MKINKDGSVEEAPEQLAEYQRFLGREVKPSDPDPNAGGPNIGSPYPSYAYPDTVYLRAFMCDGCGEIAVCGCVRA